MAGGDPKTSRALGPVPSRGDIEAEEDPLVELARIVSEDGAFSTPKSERTVRPVQAESESLADGLEAELLQELETSFARREPSPPPRVPPREVSVPTPPPRAAAAPVPPLPSQDELDPDELLRSIEEQLGQFERRHTRFAAPAPAEAEVAPLEEFAPAIEEPEKRAFGAPSAAAQSRRSSRIRPFAETSDDLDFNADLTSPELAEPSSVRSGYRFRGPANANWDRSPTEEELIEPVRDEYRSSEDPTPERQAPDFFAEAEQDSIAADRASPRREMEDFAEPESTEQSVEALRRERRDELFPEFDEPPETSRPDTGLSGIEAELSRELEPAYANMSPREELSETEPAADESRVAAVIAPGPSRRAAAARAAAAQRGRSRVGLMTAAGVVLVILIGAGGALYLRSSESGSSGPPPVIAAEEDPVRVEPTQDQAANEGETVGQAVYDRVAGTTPEAEEQVVENAEEPREIARIVLPPSQTSAENTVVGPVGEEASGGPADEASTAPSGGAEDEIGPRRVPTYVVRADGSIVETSAASPAPSDPSAEQSQQLTSETGPIEPVPVQTVAIPEGGSTAEATVQPPVPPAETPEVTADPSTVDDLTPRPTIEEEVAAVAPAEEPAADQPENPEDLLATAPPEAVEPPPQPAAAGGGYLVQLSAQRSMDQAQSAYATAQQSFPSVLGSLSPQIQEANLGEKGIYFRVRVGPWESRDDAIKVCEDLKAAGGSCFVTQ